MQAMVRLFGKVGKLAVGDAEPDLAKAEASHPLLQACRADELLQCVVLQLDSEQPQKWALMLPMLDAWSAEGRKTPPDIETLRQCCVLLEGEFAVRTLDGQTGSFSDDLRTISYNPPDTPAVAAAHAAGDASWWLYSAHKRRVVGHRTVSMRCGAGASATDLLLNCFFVSGATAVDGAAESTQSGSAEGADGGTRINVFLEKMRKPEAIPLVRRIRKFVSDVIAEAKTVARGSEPDAISYHAALPGRVKSFIEGAYGELTENTLYVGSTAEELNVAREGIEKYLMLKLYQSVFAACPKERRDDEALSRKLQQLRQVDPEALGVPSRCRSLPDQPRWKEAVAMFVALKDFKSPYDKVVSFTNACSILYFLIGTESCAEDFVPCLVLLCIHAAPANLLANVNYVAKYRTCSGLDTGEYAYYFTSLQIAVSWLADADAGALTAAAPRSPGAELADFLSTPANTAVGAPAAPPSDLRPLGGPPPPATAAGRKLAAVRAAVQRSGALRPPMLPSPGAAPSLQDLPLASVSALAGDVARLWQLEDELRRIVAEQ
eukprot:TRINITY_DN3135_c1_g1_i1.p1 TRINITY_DN3135_c1_g1~~TRINITY_DN3135_c1_g1_i1.p1  ORF type:complete len:563 (+),score=157.73 TRINITY_DN3135_c1_g1_i1:48-1691(+)